MAQIDETPTNSNEQLREEVERLRQRVSELESSLDESRTTVAALQKSERLYRIILENIPPVTYVVAVGHEPLNSAIYASPQIEKILGHTSEEFLKDPLLWVNMIHPDDRERVMAESEYADLTEGPFDAEYRVVSSGNGIAWFQDESVLVKDDHGQHLYRVGILTDVTGRKQAELALRQLENMYRRAINAAGNVPYILTHDGTHAFSFIGEGILAMTGYTASEMSADIWETLVLEAIPRGNLAHLTFEEADRITEEDHSMLWECDFRIRTRDGQVRWIADTSVKGVDEKSGQIVSIGIKQDITERKQTEIALQRLESIYRRAIDAAGAVPYLLNHGAGTYEFTFIGDAIRDMTGYSASEWTSDLWHSLRMEAIPYGSLAGLSFEEADRITNEDTSILWQCDFLIRTRGGEARWIADTSVKSLDETSGQIVSVGIFQDITERRLAEETQKKLIGELEQRNAELERLAYTLSHELKSPLITIRGFIGFLREDTLSGNIKRLEQDIARISNGADKMLRLIHELINLMSAGRIIHEPQEISLRVLVDEALELVQESLVKKNIAIRVADDLPLVYGDHKRMLEVLQNLLENSVKFMGEQPEPQIEIGQRTGQDDIPVIYIRDNGIGIDPRFTNRVFGIFDKLDGQSEGTGIGLALVKRIVEEHGGKVWAESEGLSKGSTFCFTIPGLTKAEK